MSRSTPFCNFVAILRETAENRRGQAGTPYYIALVCGDCPKVSTAECALALLNFSCKVRAYASRFRPD
jgi:hypothetical protein